MSPSSSVNKFARLSVWVAVFIALAPPVSTFVLEHRYEQVSIRIEAEINSRIIQGIINQNPEMWVYEQVRLEELLKRRAAKGNNREARQLYDKGGQLVAEQVDELDSPVLTETVPLYSSGKQVGSLSVTRSLRPVVHDSMLAALLSTILAIVIFIAVKAIPLRALRLAMKALEEEKERVTVTLQSIGDGVISLDTQMRITYLNPAAEHLIGWRASQTSGALITDIFILLDGSARKSVGGQIEECLRLRKALHVQSRVILIRSTGEAELEMDVSVAPILTLDGVVNGTVMVLHDITEQKNLQSALKHIAYHDPLTDLPNRLLLMDRLSQALASNARKGTSGALLFIDLDNFKNLNDTLGHNTGDVLLQQVAQRIVLCVREGDTVARLGGDEFVVMLEDLDGFKFAAATQAETIGEKILVTLGQAYQLDIHLVHSTSSIGITLFRGTEQQVDELMKQADIAMYQAKKAGRNTLRFFDPQMQEAIYLRAVLEDELHRALAQQQFQLHYQMQVDYLGQVSGAEALIRWTHPNNGLVPPAQFIPLAEETGLILRIGQWVIETACAQIKKWQQMARTRELTLSVNVSAKQFRELDFVAQIQATMRRHAVPPHLLKLELTESLLQENIADTVATMTALHAMGVQFSLDDFGTGYSSLQYLKQLPLDQLKIDQSFISDIATNENDKTIVQTIISMAHTLNLDVIAEGVETAAQRQCLLDNGCHHYQGYLFAKPLAIEQFEALLESYQQP